MAHWMRLIILTLAMTMVSGCTNYIYQGRIKADDSAGVSREVVLTWSKTEPLIGSAKADMAQLHTECGVLMVFENRSEGIIFRGEPGRDRVAPSLARAGEAINITTGAGVECGRVINASDLKDLDAGKVSLVVRCEPLNTEFSANKRRYIKAREEAYDFDINVSKSWSFFGETPRLPASPPCRDT